MMDSGGGYSSMYGDGTVSRPTVTDLLIKQYRATMEKLSDNSEQEEMTDELHAENERLRRVEQILREQLSAQRRLSELELDRLKQRMEKLAQASRVLSEAGVADPASSKAIERAAARVRSSLAAANARLKELRKIVGDKSETPPEGDGPLDLEDPAVEVDEARPRVIRPAGSVLPDAIEIPESAEIPDEESGSGAEEEEADHFDLPGVV